MYCRPADNGTTLCGIMIRVIATSRTSPIGSTRSARVVDRSRRPVSTALPLILRRMSTSGDVTTTQGNQRERHICAFEPEVVAINQSHNHVKPRSPLVQLRNMTDL
jgi:hypothetical protein